MIQTHCRLKIVQTHQLKCSEPQDYPFFRYKRSMSWKRNYKYKISKCSEDTFLYILHVKLNSGVKILTLVAKCSHVRERWCCVARQPLTALCERRNNLCVSEEIKPNQNVKNILYIKRGNLTWHLSFILDQQTLFLFASFL